MYHNLEEITAVEYYIVKHDLSYESVPQISPSTDTQILFFLEILNGKYTSQTDSFKGTVLNFYNPDKTFLSKIPIENWYLSNIHEGLDGFKYGQLRIIDPLGKVCEKFVANTVSGILETLVWMRSMGHYPSFETWKLSNEQELLKAEYEALVVEYTQLLSDITHTKL